MERQIFEITGNRPLARNIFEMRLRGDASAVRRAGQFVAVAVEGCFLRRPISVCDFSEHEIVLIYKVVGKGTDIMASMQAGGRLDLLTGLGNGFDTEVSCRRPLLVGGGVGVPPLYRLAKDLAAAGKDVAAVLGFNSADEIFYADEFAAAGVRTIIATADGSRGVRGFVTDAIREQGPDFDYFYACGPLPMLKALTQSTECDGQLSFEERMGCGFGACVGCTHPTTGGPKRICKEGPVLRRNEIIW